MNSSEKNGAFFLNKKPAVLLLENKLLFKGFSFGALGTITGELCFNTGMVGYQEILTDPSYCGQIVMMTYPHIGNYGINPNDIESNQIQVSGFIVKEAADYPSNFQSNQSIHDYLSEQNIVGIQGLDTRAITKVIRETGSMNAVISSTNFDKNFLLKKLENAPNMTGLNLASKVSCDSPYIYKNSNQHNFKVVAIDFGIKSNILRLLEEQGCDITVVPASTPSSEIKSMKPDGIFLSNGPGDPAVVNDGIQCIKDLLGLYPMFGICLGHQLLALALGGSTFKLKYGHRGCNHPVKNLNTGQIEISSQNHGFAVSPEGLPDNITITHINLNDNTVAGISCSDLNVFSVQYHPESCPGPHDSKYLFNDFIMLMQEQAKNA